LHLLLPIGTGTNYDKLSYGVSVKVVTFESGNSQEPRQTTTSVIGRLSQTTISQLSLKT